MVAHRAGALTVAVVAVAMLFAIGSWEVYRGAEALAQVPFAEFEYKCHQISRSPAVREDITLEDQFGFEEVTVMESLYLCAPAVKNQPEDTEPPVLPHLKCYVIVPSRTPGAKPPPPEESVTLLDQFDEENVLVTASQVLCTPVCKNPPEGVGFPECLPTPE